MQIGKEEFNVKGNYVQVDSVRFNGKVIVVIGKYLKTARFIEELHVDVSDPEFLIKGLKKSGLKPDIFTFLERFPGPEPKFDYPMEWNNYTMMHITSFDHWWNKQIPSQARTKIRKSQKKGVEVKLSEFNDELVKEIMEIYNETPIRQGKPFWHYKKDFDEVKKDLSRNLDSSDFICAYHNDELIGFIKLLYADHIADPVLCISKIKHYDKAPNNVLIAKAVEICEEKGFAHLHYGRWRDDSHARFLVSNGFKKAMIPRYYYPLTNWGKIALKLNLHQGALGIIPDNIKEILKDLRTKVISIKHRS